MVKYSDIVENVEGALRQYSWPDKQSYQKAAKCAVFN